MRILGIMKPENKQYGVDRLILRVPTAMPGGQPFPLKTPNDLFVETVTSEGDRARHLLNGAGLWLYETEMDLEILPKQKMENDLFRATGIAVSVPERIARVNKLISDSPYLPVLQSRENIERP